MLKNVSLSNGHFEVYRREEMPDRWHFKNNARAPPIFLLASKGYAFQDLADLAKIYAKANNITGKLTARTKL